MQPLERNLPVVCLLLLELDPRLEVGNEALAKGEVDRSDPLIRENVANKGVPTCERGQERPTCGRRQEGGERQKESVAQQQPEGQHAPNKQSTRPKPMGDRAGRSRGHSYLPLQRHQDNQKKGLHLRPRGQEPEGDDPPAKVLKPFRVTRPREVEAEEDKPPSKVRKSVQWMRSLLGLARLPQEPGSRQGMEKQEKEGKEREEGGDGERLTPAREEGAGSEAKTELGPSPEPGQESPPNQPSPPSMEEE